MQITFDFKLDDSDFGDIVDTAGYIIGYWADEAEYSEPHPESDSEACYSVSCEEGTEIYELHKADIEKAIKLIAEGEIKVCQPIRDSILLAVREDDYGHVDGHAADVLIQAACFGEIIYG